MHRPSIKKSLANLILRNSSVPIRNGELFDLGKIKNVIMFFEYVQF